MRLIITMLLITITCWPQSNLQILVAEAEKAFVEKDYEQAKKLYLQALRLAPENKVVMFNLAATELNLGQDTQACEHFYQSYMLNNPSAMKMMTDYCPSLRGGTVVSRNSVDLPVRFLYKNKEYPLFEDKALHPKYRKLIVDELRHSKIISGKLNGLLQINIHINSFGKFDGKLVTIIFAQNVDENLVRAEIYRIFKEAVTYVPAQKNGKNVEIIERMQLTVNYKASVVEPADEPLPTAGNNYRTNSQGTIFRTRPAE